MGFRAFFVTRHCTRPDGSCFHNYPDYVPRLFKAGHGKCGGALVHEGLKIRGRIGTLRHPLLHYAYPNWQAYRASMNYYSRLKALEMLKKKRPPIILGLLLLPAYPAATFINYYLLKRGFLMDSIGLRAAYEQARYAMIKYAQAILWRLIEHSEPELARKILDTNRT